jgi:8-oxo-dGTP diphosphatase
MARKHTYPYPAHYVTADIVVFTFKAARLHVLLVERGLEPYKGRWALPGGFLKPDEEIEACARRELAEETALQEFHLEPFATVGTVGRDPRGRVITVAHLALVRWEPGRVKGGSDAKAAGWFPADKLPPLAFDHAGIVRAARARMEEMLGERPMLLLRFLPEEFSVQDMQALRDAVLAPDTRRRDFYLGARVPPPGPVSVREIRPAGRRRDA